MASIALPKRNLLLYLITVFALSTSGAYAQYCTPTPLIGCLTGDYPAQFSMTGTTSSINDPFLTCTGGSYYYFGGYEDRTAETCAVASPSTVSCTITSNLASTSGGYTYTSYGYSTTYVSPTTESVQLWVDWDNNSVFDATESIGGLVPLNGSLQSFSASIPAGIASGDYRMRLVLSSAESYPGMDPCMYLFGIPGLNYNSGDAIDYIVHVGSTVTCPTPTLTVSAITCTSATISWGAVTGATGYEYVIDGSSGSPSGSGTATTATTYTATGLTPSTGYYAHVRTNCGTGFSAWATVPFTTATSTIPAITGGTSVCVGSSLPLSDATSGGTWSSSNTGVATVNSSGVAGGVSVGSATITYWQGGCYKTLGITVTTGLGPITGSTTFCATGTTTLSNATPGGAWSSDNTAVATVAGGVVHGVGAGTANIVYTVSGCTATIAVTLEPNNGGTITGADSICKGAVHAVQLTASTPGGTWSSSNTSRATVDPSTGLVTCTNTSGSFVISYVVSNTCGTFTVTHTMYIRSASRCALGVDPTAAEQSTQLKIFPNPNGGSFTVNLASDIAEDVQVVVTNLVGEEVTEFTTATNKTVDVTLKSPPGIYMLNATTNHGKYVAKVVIEK